MLFEERRTDDLLLVAVGVQTFGRIFPAFSRLQSGVNLSGRLVVRSYGSSVLVEALLLAQ